MSELTDATAAITELLATYSGTRDEMVQVLSGPKDGGPTGDGYYPVTLPDGTIKKVASVSGVYGAISANQIALVQVAASLVNLQTMFVNHINKG